MPSSEEPASLPRLRRLVRLMDDAVAVPGTRIRFGLDALLGLIPGVGDVAGAAVSGRVVVSAARLGAPPAVLTRMVGNMAVDALIGEIPLVGDLFDVGWKANRKNLELLERHLADPEAAHRGSRRWVAVAVAAAILTPVLVLAAAAWLFLSLVRALPL